MQSSIYGRLRGFLPGLGQNRWLIEPQHPHTHFGRSLARLTWLSGGAGKAMLLSQDVAQSGEKSVMGGLGQISRAKGQHIRFTSRAPANNECL